MRLTGRLAVNLVAVLLLGVITVGWLISNVVGNGIFNSPYAVTADFASSGGVFTNQEVTYRGVTVGKVGDLTLDDGDGVIIELLIFEEWRDRIPKDVAATVQSKSAVGEQFVNLTPISTEAGEMLAEGDRIPRHRTSLPVDFQALLGSLDKVLRDIPPERVARLTRNLAAGIGGRGDEISTILTSLSDLSVAFASVAPEQQRLLDSATTAGAEFLRTKEEFAAAIQASDDVLEGLGDEPGELSAFFRANDRLARRGSALLARHGEDLAGGIKGFADLVEFQNDERTALIQSLEYVPAFLHAIEDASIPWTSPDGRSFYRIRAGLVWDNVRSSWPCQYRVPEDYPRFPHQREARTPVTTMACVPESDTEAAAATRALISELRSWARQHRDEFDEGSPVEDGVPVGIEATISDPIASLLTPPTPTPTPSPEPTSTP